MTGAERPDEVTVNTVGGIPTAAHAAMVSPTATDCVSQDVLSRFRSISVNPALARIEFGVKLTSLEHRPDGVRAFLGDVRTGESRMVDARYLIAADGDGFDGTASNLYDRYWPQRPDGRPQ